MSNSTIKRMRAKHKLWSAGRYLQDQYNAGMFTEELSPSEQLSLWQAAQILLERYNALLAN